MTEATVEGSSRVSVLLLVPFELRVDGRPHDVVHWPRRAGALVRLLASTAEKRRRREEVAEILWPESAPEAAAANLRSVIHRLKVPLGGNDVPLVRTERGWVSLNPALSWEVDLDELARVVESGTSELGAMQQAAALVRGEPLPDDRYDDWALPVRTYARGLWRDLCFRLSDATLHAGEAAAAAQWASRVLELDPLDESALRRVVRSLAAAGQRTEALRTFALFERTLRDELAVAPSTETLVLVDRLRADTTSSTAGTRPPAVATQREESDNIRRREVLPDDPTPFVGRERELSALRSLLSRPAVRLVTLSGPGGTGKTRLALRLGRELLAEFRDGVVFVPLASLLQPEDVAPAVAASLEVRAPTGSAPVEVLTEFLRNRRLLLILDNFEQLLDARQLVADLLDLCLGLHIVVTSREVLHLNREHVFDVPPLELPAAYASMEVDDLLRFDAVALFRQRARAASASFELNEGNARVVAEICCRLDGLPLAIELAAARIRHFPPAALLARLSSRLSVLTGGARDLPARRQTMRDAIGWSFELLSTDEQELFTQLSVFAGGCSLAAAEAVCVPREAGYSIVDGLTSLVDKSLLRQSEEGDAEPRFMMLQTIREFARERLDGRVDAEAVRERHAAYFLALVQEVARESSLGRIGAPPSYASLPRIEREHDNISIMLRWAIERRRVEPAIAMFAAVAESWRNLGRYFELAAWWSALRPFIGQTSGLTRAHALSMLTYIEPNQSEPAQTERLRREAIELARRHADEPLLLYLMISVAGMDSFEPGTMSLSEELLPEAITLARKLGSPTAEAAGLRSLAQIAQQKYRNRARARALFEESLALERAQRNRMGVAYSLHGLAWLALLDGEDRAVHRLGREAASLYRELGNRTELMTIMAALAVAALRLGEVDDVLRMARDTRTAAHFVGDPRFGVGWLEALGAVCALRGLPVAAAQIWGALDAHDEREGMTEPGSAFEPFFAPYRAGVRAELSEDEWSRARAVGARMSVEEAFAYGLREAGTSSRA